MQPVSLAPFIYAAVFAFSGSGPLPVAHDLKAGIPSIKKIIVIDISLDIIRPKTGTSGYRTVNKDRSDVNAGTAEKGIIACFEFIIPEESFAARRCFDLALLFCFYDKIVDRAELPVA
jgi:hypothetical protein